MMDTTKLANWSLPVVCPCCGKAIEIRTTQSDDGKPTIGLFCDALEAEYADIQAHGYEFGVVKGGEEDHEL